MVKNGGRMVQSVVYWQKGILLTEPIGPETKRDYERPKQKGRKTELTKTQDQAHIYNGDKARQETGADIDN